MIYGYARCSTNENKQDIQRQIEELRAAGAEEIVFEYEHGEVKENRKLYILLNKAQCGDLIIASEVSRLSRNTQQICEILDIIKKNKLCLLLLDGIIADCRDGSLDAISQAFIQMSAVFAELEVSVIRSRVKSGIRHARSKNQALGRPPLTRADLPPLFIQQYSSFQSGQMNVSQLAKACNLSRPTVYKYLKLMI